MTKLPFIHSHSEKTNRGVIQGFSEDRGLSFLKYENRRYETHKYEEVKTQEYQNN